MVHEHPMRHPHVLLRRRPGRTVAGAAFSLSNLSSEPPAGDQARLAGGSAGKRFALPNARTVIHQPFSGVSGQAADIDIQAKEVVRLRTRLNEILSLHTGQTQEQIAKDTDRDFIMDPQHAKEYGLIDEVMVKREPTS